MENFISDKIVNISNKSKVKRYNTRQSNKTNTNTNSLASIGKMHINNKLNKDLQKKSTMLFIQDKKDISEKSNNYQSNRNLYAVNFHLPAASASMARKKSMVDQYRTSSPFLKSKTFVGRKRFSQQTDLKSKLFY